MPNYLRRRGHARFFRWKWPARLAPFGLADERERDERIELPLSKILRPRAAVTGSTKPGPFNFLFKPDLERR